MSGEYYADIYKIVKSITKISWEEFEKMVREVYERNKGKISVRAAAIVVARKLGVEPIELIYPPVVGRLIEVGPVRMAKSIHGETPFVLFAIVNERERIQGVAFGRHHVELLRGSEDKVISIRGYTKVKLEKYSGIKVTEKTTIEILDDNYLPPITELRPAWAESLAFVKSNKGAWLVRVVILESIAQEYQACPICGRAVEMSGDSWICPEHGVIDDPKTERVWRFMISDSTGVYVGVYFKSPPEGDLTYREAVMKGYFRDNEFYIMRIYEVSEEPVLEVN